MAAAAQTYFNKSLDQLSPAEAATLASMPKAPSDYNPVTQKERLTSRRNYVLNEMFQNGYIDEATYRNRARGAAEIGAERRLSGVPRGFAAARLFHR